MSQLVFISHRLGDLIASVSIEISITVLVAALLSLFLLRAAPRYRYLLWLMVLLRVAVPVPLELPFETLPHLQGLYDLSSPQTFPVPQAAQAPVRQITSKSSAQPLRQNPLSQQPLRQQIDTVSVQPQAQPKRPVPQVTIPQESLPADLTRPSRTAADLAGVDILAAVWLTGVLLMAAVVATRSLFVRRMLRRCRPVQRPELLAMVASISTRLGLRRTARVVWAGDDVRLPLPAVLGTLRPTIVLPESIAQQWPIAELESILVHELVHVRRLDPLINAIQRWLQVMLFFHPMVWFVNWRLRCERELACDDEVVAYYQGKTLPYLRSLVRFAELRLSMPRFRAGAIGLAEPTSSLENRVRRMRNRTYRKTSPGQRLISLVAVLILAGVSFTLSARPAQQLRIEGLVVTEFPVKNVELRIWDRSQRLLAEPQRLREPLHSSQLSPGQPFSIELKNPSLPMLVEIWAAGHVALAYEVVLPQQTQLPPAFLRQGRMVQLKVTQSGKPAPEALVAATIQWFRAVRYPGRWDAVIAHQLTDERGQVTCVLPDVEGRIHLHGVSTDGAWGAITQDMLAADLFRLRLDSQPVMVKVVDEKGKPIPGMMVAEADAPPGTAVFTDKMGNAQVHTPAVGGHKLIAFGRSTAGWFTLNERPRNPVEIEAVSVRMLELSWEDSGLPIVLKPSWLPQAFMASRIAATGGAARVPILGQGGRLEVWGPGIIPTEAQIRESSTSAIALDIKPECRVRGKVQSGAGTPLPNTPVWAEVPPWWNLVNTQSSGFTGLKRAWLPWAVSSADGTFEINHLPTEFELEARMPGLVPGRSGSLSAKHGATLRPILVLGPGVQLTLRTIDPDGIPIPGVLTELFSASAGRRGADPDLTGLGDDQGVVVLEHARVGHVLLSMKKSGYVTRLLSEMEIPAEGIDLGEMILEPGVTVLGTTVNPQGRPVGYAEVALITDPEQSYFVPTTVSDAAGRFEIHDLEASGEIYVLARAEGLVPRPPLKVTMPPADPVEVGMDAERVLRGIVTEAGTRTPLQDVEIRLSIERSSFFPGGHGSSVYAVGTATTDRSGRFVISGLGPGSYRLDVDSADHCSAALEITVPADREPDEVQVTLEPGLDLAVQVLDPEGQPAAASRVTLAPLSSSTQNLRVMAARGTTDADGSYTFHGLAEQTYRYEATGAAGEQASGQVQVGADEALVIQLEATGSISGIVFDPQGIPAGDIDVTAYFRSSRATAITTADGRFRLEKAVPGDWQVIAKSEIYAMARKLVLVESGLEAELELRLERGGVITGSVLGLNAGELQSCSVYGGAKGVRVGINGTFRLEGVPIGTQQITALVSPKDRTRVVTVEVPESGEPVTIEFDFGSGYTLGGNIRRGNAPAPAVVVTVSGMAGFAGNSTASGEEGDWIIEGLEKGEYLVELKDQLGRVLTGKQVLVDSDTRLDLELPQASISGVVLTADDRIPVAGASVELNGHGFPGVQRKVSSDTSGRFLLEDLPDSTYSISAEAAERGSVHEVIEVEDGLSRDLTLLVKPDNDLVLQVRRPDGTNPEGIWVELLHSGLISGFAVPCEAGGRCSISSMSEGLSTLLVSADRDSALIGVVLPSGEVPVSLKKVGEIHITATPSETGKQWQARIIEAGTGLVVPDFSYNRRGGGEWIGVESSGYTIYLPAGTYLVEVNSPAGEVDRKQVEVSPGGVIEVTFG